MRYLLILSFVLSIGMVTSAHAGAMVQTKCADGYKIVIVTNKYKMNSFQLMEATITGQRPVKCKTDFELKQAELEKANAMAIAKQKVIAAELIGKLKREAVADAKRRYGPDATIVWEDEK